MAGQTSSKLTDLLGLIRKIPHPRCKLNSSSNVEAAAANQYTSEAADQKSSEEEPPADHQPLVCLECDSCKYMIQLDKLKRNVSCIQDSLDKQSKFEHNLANYIHTLPPTLTEGSSLSESSLLHLDNAVMQLRFQLPSPSYYHLPNQNPHPPPEVGGAQADTPILESIYDTLSREEKKCLHCFSVFSGEVKKRVLINWWIGQGFLSSNGNGGGLEQAGEDMLARLKEKQIIQQITRKKRPTNIWVMEPSSREFLRETTYAGNFFDFTGQREEAEVILLKSDTQIGNPTSTSTSKKVKTVFNIQKSSFTDSEAETLAYMENLVVLHLGRSQITVPRRIIRLKNRKTVLKRLHKMKSLRLLSLQGITIIRKLPDSVCRIASLMVLDLSECQALESLPLKIRNLKCLTHLDLSGCPLLLQMPKGIRSLLKLEVLKGFVIGHKAQRGSCSLNDLWMLKKLHKLSIFVRKENFPQPQDLKHLHNIEGLVKLKIVWKPGSLQGQQNVSSAPYVQGEPNPEPAVNEAEVESVVNVYNQQHQVFDDDEQTVTRSVNLQQSQEYNNDWVECEQDLDNNDDQVNNNLSELHKFLPSCFRNQVQVQNRRVAQQRLEKLDLWCPPDCAAEIMLSPSNFGTLKKLYIRGAKFKRLSSSRDAEGKWQNVKILRLLFLSELEMEQDQLKLLFSELTYLELRNCPKIRFPECDDEGVWEKTIPSTSSNVPSL